MSPVSGKKLLVIAVVCGLLAATAAWLYLKAKESQYRDAYRPAVEEKISVVVPRQDIGKSQVMSRELVASLDVPRQFLPSNAVTTEEWSRLEGSMTIAPMQRGRPITWDAVEHDRVSRFSENVELGKRIKTVKISKINSFDGMLRPGDHIDLMGVFSATDIGLQKQPNYADDVVMAVIEDVVVVAAGREDAGGRKFETYYDQSTPDGFNMNFSTVSLMLSPAQAARVELAEKAGSLVAVLRHPKDTSLSDLGQVTVANLLDPPPVETVDVVLDAAGNLVGRTIGDNIVDANGKIIGKIVDGQAVGFDGQSLGRIVRGLAADDPLLRMAERADVVRDDKGNVIGRIEDGKVVDLQGNAIGIVIDGKAVGIDGQALGRIERNVALDAKGRVIDMSRSTAQVSQQAKGTERQVVRDASGNVVGWVEGDKVLDAKGEVIGAYRDGQAKGLDGANLGTVGTVLVDREGRIMGELGEVVRDADGKIIGKVIDGKLVDASGKVLGQVRDGKVVDAKGQVLGQVEQAMLDASGRPIEDSVRVVLDADGNAIGTVVGDSVVDAQGRKIGSVKDGQFIDNNGRAVAGARISLQEDASIVVRDASGNALGTLRGDVMYDAQGKAIGKLVEGKIVDANGNIIHADVRTGVENAQAHRSTQNATGRQAAVSPMRMIQFIPGGTGKDGVIPVQTLRME